MRPSRHDTHGGVYRYAPSYSKKQKPFDREALDSVGTHEHIMSRGSCCSHQDEGEVTYPGSSDKSMEWMAPKGEKVFRMSSSLRS